VLLLSPYGNTFAIGPEFDVAGQPFYIEDTAFITKDGYELINSPVPYSAAIDKDAGSCEGAKPKGLISFVYLDSRLTPPCLQDRSRPAGCT